MQPEQAAAGDTGAVESQGSEGAPAAAAAAAGGGVVSGGKRGVSFHAGAAGSQRSEEAPAAASGPAGLVARHAVFLAWLAGFLSVMVCGLVYCFPLYAEYFQTLGVSVSTSSTNMRPPRRED